MQQTSIILMGRSGSGKGTQGERLVKYLGGKSIYIQSGGELREFIKGDTLTQKLAKEIYDKGGLEPEFLMIYLWAGMLTREFTGSEHIIIDGTPRKLHEAGALHSVFAFYKVPKPIVLYINVSKESAGKRLLGRGRTDDHRDEIERRLEWFDTDVMPTIEYYRSHPDYRFIEIDGELSIDAVYAQIVEKISAAQ